LTSDRRYILITPIPYFFLVAEIGPFAVFSGMSFERQYVAVAAMPSKIDHP
jgi:hypothetical protein